MNNSERVIVVTGATGQQGGATARALLNDGWRVRALVRDPHKPQAQELAAAGAELVQGEYDDRAALDRAFAGAHGVFSVQTPFAAGGTAAETRQGIAVAEAADAAGVGHLVYTSVGGAERNTGIPHFDSKWAVEQQIARLGIPATVLRPVFFMENFRYFMPPQEQNGVLTFAVPMRPDRPLQLIATVDIGAFAALAFARPEEFVGKGIELAGDNLTLVQVAELWGQKVGQPTQFFPVPVEALRESNEDSYHMFSWFNAAGYSADIPALRALRPELLDFAGWLERNL